MNWEKLKDLIQNPDYTKKKIRLADGRRLSYSQCGNTKSGIPVLFCFGLMTSSVAVMFAHYAALKHNLRIIAVDYPGIGESTFQEDRSLGGWPDDMQQFCDKVLGKGSRVRLLGHSLGGLHALALLSDRRFKARVERVVLLSPWRYIEGEEFSPFLISMARNMPHYIQSQIIPAVLTSLSSGSLQVAGWSNPQHRQINTAQIVTSYGCLQGQAGNEQMVRFALSKSEMYVPQDLEAPIFVYHGNKDNLVLETAVLELVELLRERNCKVTFISVSDGDHNSIMAEPKNLNSVMESLVGTDSENMSTTRFNQMSTAGHGSQRRNSASHSLRGGRESVPVSLRTIIGNGNKTRDSVSEDTPHGHKRRHSVSETLPATIGHANENRDSVSENLRTISGHANKNIKSRANKNIKSETKPDFLSTLKKSIMVCRG
jgi:pimeloyl-ACP methyl ester carboxylesterase